MGVRDVAAVLHRDALAGKVDVYDLRALAKVGTVDVGQQAGGIAFWKMEPAAK